MPGPARVIRGFTSRQLVEWQTEHKMPVYSSAEQFYAVMQELFAEVMRHPEQIDSFLHSNLVVRVKTYDPETEMVLDGRQPPLGISFGPQPGRANLEILLSADLLHAHWLGAESTQQAFFDGRIRTRGNLLKAMQLLELFAEAERSYPAVADRHGLTPV